MRIVLCCPYALSVFGGVQEQVLAMSRELAARGHEVLVVAPDESDHSPHDTAATIARFGRLSILPANGSRAPLTLSGRASRAARATIASFDPDVVHYHEPFAPRIGYAALRSHRWPSIATFHRSGEGPAVTLTRPLLRRLATGIDASAAVSDLANETAIAACGLRSTVLFNGFDMVRFQAFPRRSPTPPVLVTVGRLEERKGVATAIDAVMLHNAQVGEPERWRLLVIGDGDQRLALERRAQSPLISFLGAVSEPEKRRLLRSASVALCPALYGESFGLVVLEAMASEVPVVASDIPGYAAAASRHATLFRVGDAADLERAIQQALVTTPEAIEGARAHAAAWSMASLVDHYEGLYEAAKIAFAAR